MKKFLLAATAATVALAMSSAANAAPTFAFIPFGSTAATGFNVLEDFDGAPTLSYTLAGGALVKSAPSDPDGATLPNSVPTGTDYLSVVGGGSAVFTFDAPLNGFAFEWGSVDSYNTLTVYFVGGPAEGYAITGSTLTDPANGNQILPGTNGLLLASGELFTGFRLDSSQNSFEIDNIASVPEPASWAMMIAGIAAIGFSMRRRSQNVRVAFS